MKAYLIKRLFLILPTLFGITVITFLVIRLAPGDPAELRARSGQNLSSDGGKNLVNAQIIAATRRIYELDKPIHIQYAKWVKRIFTLNFGDSFQDHRPVIQKIRERLPITIALNIISMLLAYLVAIPLGIYSAAFQGTRTDRLITFVNFMLYSLPSFWIATMAIVFLCGGDYWRLFPPGGIQSIAVAPLGFWQQSLDVGWHLVLPVACLTYGSFAFLSQQMRVGMLEVIRQDYIRTARAKGLSEWTVIMKHALRNSLIPILTIIADILPALIGGSVIIETIFSIPGMGRLGFEAILYRDYPVIMAVFTVSALLTLVGFLISDLLYAVVDPRISFRQRNK